MGGQESEDLVGIGEAAGLVLGVDPVAVNLHVEYPAVALDQRRVDAVLCLDCGRQTGGLWQIVSAYAVFDCDLHPSDSSDCGPGGATFRQWASR